MDSKNQTIFFSNICEENYKRIFQYILVKTHDYTVAEDLVQTVFLVAWEKREMLMSHPNIAGFLYLTAQNTAFSYMRAKNKNPIPLAEEDLPAQAIDDAFTVIERERDSKIDENLYIDGTLRVLPPKDKELYDDFYCKKLPVKAIAQKNKVSETSIRMRLMRLRKKVKKEISKQSFDLL